nr:tape measure protein [Brevibacterium sp. 91QC2O2]
MGASDATFKFQKTMSFAGLKTDAIDKARKTAQVYADETVYDLPTIQNMIAQLSSNGVADYEGLTKAAGNLNAVAGGNADTFKSVAMVMTQTAGAGKLTTENWNQMSDAIPGAAGPLMEALKKSGAYTGNFREAMEKGKISSTEFNKALTTLGTKPVAVEAAKSTETFEGAVGNMQASAVGGFTDMIDKLKPQLTQVITTIGNGIQQAFTVVTPILDKVIGSFQTWGPILGTVVGAVVAYKTAMLGVAAVTGTWNAIMKIAKGIQIAWTGVQWALNAAMNANPVGLIIIAIAALVGAFVLMYNKVGWFRDFINGVWSGIKNAAAAVVGWFQTSVVPVFQAVWDGIVAAASWAYNNILKPIFNALQIAFLVVATAIGLYWKVVLKPVFTAISTVAQWLWNTVLKPVFGWIQNGWNFLVNGIKLLWESVLRPALNAVGTFAMWLWTNAIKPAWNGIKAGWTWMVNGIKAAWNNLLKPALSAVGTAVKFLKDSVWTPTVNGIRKAWDLMAGGIRTVKTNIIDPVFEGIKKAVHAVKRAFEIAKDGIATAWGKLKEITRKPVEFIVNTVYTNGIRKVWNGIAGAVGMKDKQLPEVKFADGGVMPGYTPGKDVHHFYSPTAGGLHLSGGEAIMRPEFTRAVGGPVGIAQMNMAARQGGSRGLANYLKFGGESSSAFADGGVWAAAGKNGGALPSAVSRAQAWARSQVGKPYIWGGTGPAGYDCSGFMSAITNVLTGRSPYGRLFATGSFSRGRGAAGFQPGLQGSAFSIGVSPNTGSGIGHTAGTLGGMNVESYGHHGPATGSGARGADDGLFPWKFHLPTVGGQFVSGGGRTGGGGGGSLINLAPLTNLIKKLAKIPKAGGWSDMISGAVKGMINKLVSVATPFGGGGAIAETASKWVSAGKAMAVRAKGIAWALSQGWGPAEVKDMDWIIQRESGWNNKSTGGTSSATGLPQFLTMQCDEQGFAAPLSQYSMEFQLQAMKRYVDGRFGNFASAKKFWQSHHWYDQGGVIPTSLGVYDNGGPLPAGGAAVNLSSSSEYVLTGPQSDLLTAGLRQMQAAPAGAGGTTLTIETLNVTVGDVYGVDDLHTQIEDGLEESLERILREWEERR